MITVSSRIRQSPGSRLTTLAENVWCVFSPFLLVLISALQSEARDLEALDCIDNDDIIFEFPGGSVCPGDFTVRLTGFFSEHVDLRDKQTAKFLLNNGVGCNKVFERLDEKGDVAKKVVVKGRRGIVKTVPLGNGLNLATSTGTFLLVMFPTDFSETDRIPAGPSITLTNGKMTLTATETIDYNVLDFKGRTTDICAALMET
jgi:hypothetical protein